MRNIPNWYTPGDVVDSLSAACRISDLAVSEIVNVLVEHEFDADRERVRSLVETQLDGVDATDTGESHGRSNELEATDDPREPHERFTDADDVAYLSEREFARVLGVVLSRYEGTYRTPTAVDELDVDVFWNRSHVTVGLRTVPKPTETLVDAETVNHLVQGRTNPPTGRNPSVLGVVSNTGFTDAARRRATEGDIELYGPAHLKQWFSDAKLTPAVFGAILEEGEQQESDLQEQIDDLPALPNVVRSRDPLGEVSRDTWQMGGDGDSDYETGETPTVKQRIPVEDRRPATGEHGRLYADPSDDGDFGAFDDYLDELNTDGDDR